MNANLPLEGLTVIDLSQFLAGPLASLKLADMGAKVIKIERPGAGDLTRSIYLSDTDVEGINTLFHAINRNKLSFTADLKSEKDLEKVRKLLSIADVVIQNFRPGVIERLGLDYESVKLLNPSIIYASISGYGVSEEWHSLPGQDLLAQAKSGLMWLNGNDNSPPSPVGLALADMLTGHNATQGILAALVRKGINQQGAHIETSLIESTLDFQFEVLTTYLNDGNRDPVRSKNNSAHAYLAAPYGVYETQDGYVAIAMAAVNKLGTLIGSEELAKFHDKQEWFSKRDEIKEIIAKQLKMQTSLYWMDIFVSADIWASEVLDWKTLMKSKGFNELDFIQELHLSSGEKIKTTRSPIRIDGQLLKSTIPAPLVGEHTKEIITEFKL